MMRKLPEVEHARELMTEAMAWSVMKWLREKKRVRKTADEANAALDHLNQVVKQGWAEEVRVAYRDLVAQADAQGRQQLREIDPEVALFARTVKKADEAASRARMDAENTFDEAERQLSTSLAREGCRKAIFSWDLHEKAIGKAEAPIRSSKP
jgi:hypothetical protein